MAARWTPEEDNLLTEVYPSNLKQDIIEKLGKPWLTIHRRAIRLNLRRDPNLINQDRKKRGPRKDRWTPEEENLLKEIFENNTKTYILQRINRPWQGIYIRSKHLGLVRNPDIVKQEMIEGGKSVPAKENAWTEKEDRLLKTIYGKKRKKEIQAALNRSWSAIRGRAIKLGVTRDKELAKLDNIENSQTAMLEKYGVKSGFELPGMQEKIRKSYQKNLNVDFPMQSKAVQNKAKVKFRSKYGVDNPFQAEEIKQKSQKTMLERHGVKSPLQSIEFKHKALESLKQRDSFDVSNTEANFYLFLKSIDPNTEHQIIHPVTGSKIDFYMPSLNVWVQYDGDYWHGHINQTNNGERNTNILNTIKNDEKQNKLIPNLIRFKESEVLEAIESEEILSFIESRLKKKSKIDFTCHQHRIKTILLSVDAPFLAFDHSKLKASDFSLQHEKYSKELSEFIKRYEWLGTVGTTPKWCFTARYKNKLGAVVLINEPNAYSKLLGPETRIYEALIQRGASASWTPKNIGSRLIMFSCRWMIQNTEKRLFIGYGDPKAHEIGTIYQACNFDYLGDHFGTGYLYVNPEINEGRPFSAQSLKRTSSFRKWLRKKEIEIQPGWIKPNGYKDLSALPLNLKKAWNDWVKETIDKSSKIPTNKKHKYALLLPKNKKEKKALLPCKNYKTKKPPKRGNAFSENENTFDSEIIIPHLHKKQKRTNIKSRITPEKDAFIVSNYKKMTQKEISDAIGETKRWVSSRVRYLIKTGTLEAKHGIGSTKSRISADKIKFIKENRDKMSYEEMAFQLKETKRWVKRQTNKLNKK